MLAWPRVGDVTVLSGATDSPAIISEHTISDAEDIAFKSPATLPETATLQISFDFDVDYQLKVPQLTLAAAAAAATWVNAPAGATLGAAGASTNFKAGLLLAAAWRIHLSGAAAADRAFQIYKRVYGTAYAG